MLKLQALRQPASLSQACKLLEDLTLRLYSSEAEASQPMKQSAEACVQLLQALARSSAVGSSAFGTPAEGTASSQPAPPALHWLPSAVAQLYRSLVAAMPDVAVPAMVVAAGPAVMLFIAGACAGASEVAKQDWQRVPVVILVVF